MDHAGRFGEWSNTVSQFVILKPNGVKSLTANRQSGFVHLSWQTVEGAHYEVYRGKSVANMLMVAQVGTGTFIDESPSDDKLVYGVKTVRGIHDPITDSWVVKESGIVFVDVE